MQVKKHIRKTKNKATVVKTHSRSCIKKSKGKYKGLAHSKIAQKVFNEHIVNMQNSHFNTLKKD